MKVFTIEWINRNGVTVHGQPYFIACVAFGQDLEYQRWSGVGLTPLKAARSAWQAAKRQYIELITKELRTS